MTRIAGVDPDSVEDPALRAAFENQGRRWGRTFLSHGIYARRPTIYQGARGMWRGLDESGLLDPRLVALLNRRVAAINGCEF
jgi:hypothetical protein